MKIIIKIFSPLKDNIFLYFSPFGHDKKYKFENQSKNKVFLMHHKIIHITLLKTFLKNVIKNKELKQ